MSAPLVRPDEAGGAGRGRGRTLARAAAAAAAVVVLAALAGVVWEWWWTPPEGVALDDEFVFTPEGITRAFSGTGLYVVVAAVLGLALGALVALRSDGHEVAALLALLVGSTVGAWVMGVVGAALGPPDADRAVRGLKDYTSVPQDLQVEGAAAWLTLPTATLVAAAAVFLVLSRRRHD